MAVSGGRTPWKMLAALAAEDVPWPSVQIVQVDDRSRGAAWRPRPQSHPSTRQPPRKSSAAARADSRHAGRDPRSRCGRRPVRQGAQITERVAASSRFAVHLGLGPDGHTASAIPGDPVLNVVDRDVAATGLYQERRRMTLTYPIINRARRILWLVTGADKSGPLRQLREGDPSIPAGRVNQENSTVLADQAAAAEL